MQIYQNSVCRFSHFGCDFATRLIASTQSSRLQLKFLLELGHLFGSLLDRKQSFLLPGILTQISSFVIFLDQESFVKVSAPFSSLEWKYANFPFANSRKCLSCFILYLFFLIKCPTKIGQSSCIGPNFYSRVCFASSSVLVRQRRSPLGDTDIRVIGVCSFNISSASYFVKSELKSIPSKKGCFINSPMSWSVPKVPNRSYGFIWISLSIKSTTAGSILSFSFGH